MKKSLLLPVIALSAVAAPLISLDAAEATQQYSHGDPTPEEQLILELVNRARANPLAEAQRLGIDLNANLAAGTISSTPKAPLGFHPLLIDAGRAHSQWMLDADVFDHTGQNGSNPHDRMVAAGYPFIPPWALAENIGYSGTTGNPDVPRLTAEVHDGLFKSAGHRVNLMNDRYDEVGIGVLVGVFTDDQSGNDFNSVMVTENFAVSGGTAGPLVVGVVYRDTDGNGIYSVGEGVENVRVTVQNEAAFAVTSRSGGYAIPIKANNGTVSVSISGEGIRSNRQMNLTGQNVKADFNLLALSAEPEVVPGSVRWNPEGFFEFQVTGTSGQQVRIESSADLSNWSLLQDGVLTATPFTVSDRQAAGQYRFYRVVAR